MTHRVRVILATMCMAAAAQRVGGVPAGRPNGIRMGSFLLPNPLPMPRPGFPRIGRNPSSGWNGASVFGSAALYWPSAPWPVTPDPVIEDQYPPLLVLKTGGVYSVTRYWIKSKTLYFVTPRGETLYVPLALLESSTRESNRPSRKRKT